MKLMSERGFVLNSLEDLKCAQSIKEEYCQVKLQQQMNMANNHSKSTNVHSKRMLSYRTTSY
jgi:hypothetical protein